MYDYIIVGAGINGKILAYLLSFNTNKILLIDKKNINKDIKLESIIITNKYYEILKQLLKFDLNTCITKKMDNIIINGKKFNLNIIVLNLKKLENKLVEDYKKNKGKVLDKIVINKYDFKNNNIFIMNKKYQYKKLIAADGTMSEIRINLTNKIQKFRFALQIKTNKVENRCILNTNKKLKTLEWVIPLRRSNLIKLSNKKKKNNTFKNLNELNYTYEVNKKNGYFIPNNDLLFKINNIYFIGDASGLINPIFDTSFGINVKYLEKLYDHLINNQNINYKKIRYNIIKRRILSKLLYLPLLNKIAIIIIFKIGKEDLC